MTRRKSLTGGFVGAAVLTASCSKSEDRAGRRCLKLDSRTRFVITLFKAGMRCLHAQAVLWALFPHRYIIEQKEK